ncbi:MAG TPA: hypothetical protein DDW27_19865 [Bacteroidales bacterium]|nr:hypothetical protein [Bacteroidales bacterium]
MPMKEELKSGLRKSNLIEMLIVMSILGF